MTQINNNDPASKEVIAVMLEVVRNSFAPRSDDFFKSMADMLVKGGYSEKQLKDAINEVISTCGFNQLSIAAVIAACNSQPPQICEWEITTFKEIRRATYDQFKVDQNRYGKENVKFIRDIESYAGY